ncbi:MAG TPA: phosphodiester glycosidase family protein [Anaerolineales bacterium]|nr:phosphodiester glycosidase family protein [Anaerolineales bacterium]
MKNATEQGSISVHHRCNWIRRLVAAALILLLALTATLTIVPAALPGFGANMADFLRLIFGPQPVARLESVSFKLHDELNRFLYNGGKPQIAWNYSTQPEAFTLGGASKLASPRVQDKPSLLSEDVVSASPQIGWQAYGPSVNGVPVLARAMVLLDPRRSYAGVALVRMDLSKLELHMMPGYLEPAHPALLAQVIPKPGMIPSSDQNYLVAAFNGGFKAIHGHYGMMVDGVTLLPPISNIATVAIYHDGHVQIGAWGKDIVPSSDIIAFRQNCPPLLEAGQLNPNLLLDNQQAWGYTANSDITWRTGLGITQDGLYLIYAVGNGTSAATLARALQSAGAYSAMQLDINQYYAHFDTYQPVKGSATSQGFQLAGEPLLDKMINDPRLYLTPSMRDFFYLSVHSTSSAQQKAPGG